MHMRGVTGKYFWLLIGVVSFCLVVVIGIAFIQITARHKSSTAPPLETTANLLKTTKNLRDSFGTKNTDNEKITRQYISYTQVVSDECSRLVTAADTSKASSSNADTIILLKNSKKLCKDLLEVSKTTTLLYSTLLPVLSIHPTTKRYQTLPLIKQTVISSQKNKVGTSLNDLKKSHIKNDEYIKLAIKRLETLQNNMKSAQGFSYLSSLQAFQAQQIAERQQYWTGFSDIVGLVSALQLQLQNYCQAAPTKEAKSAVCTANATKSNSNPTPAPNASEESVKVLN